MIRKFLFLYREDGSFRRLTKACAAVWGLALVGVVILITLCSCASLPQAHSDYPIIHALPFQKGDVGFYFLAEDRDYMVKEGVPLSLFASTPRGWYLTRLQEIEAANIIHTTENPITWKSSP